MLHQAAFLPQAEALPLLRGALHCHTTRSDGCKTPAETLKFYAGLGYDFAAITDHDCYNFRNDAPQTGMLVLPGVEIEGKLQGDLPYHVFHVLGIGRGYEKGVTYEQDQHITPGKVADQHAFIPYVRDLQGHGNLTVYCHPQWSATPAREFEAIPGNFAMEIWNTSCYVENDMDTNACYWDELLAQGKRIFGVATDDAHVDAHYNLGWVMVRARKEPGAVLDALRAGAFYSSCGPEIYDFYVDEGRAYICCSPCGSICFVYDRTPSYQAVGDGLREAGDRLPPGITYVRGVCKDSRERRAWTNPIFLP